MKHHKHSLAGRLAAFFEANPQECLTLEDIMAKFDCTRRNAHVAIWRLQLGSITVYRASGSTKLPEIEPARAS